MHYERREYVSAVEKNGEKVFLLDNNKKISKNLKHETDAGKKPAVGFASWGKEKKKYWAVAKKNISSEWSKHDYSFQGHPSIATLLFFYSISKLLILAEPQKDPYLVASHIDLTKIHNSQKGFWERLLRRENKMHRERFEWVPSVRPCVTEEKRKSTAFTKNKQNKIRRKSV